MKILFTGGGSGGHFYPIAAVVDVMYDIIREKKILMPDLILAADSKYDSELIEREGLKFRKIYAGKIRRYPSFLNFTDLFKSALGVLKAIWLIYSEMPDVVFGKGGYASFPPLLAARLFGIPVMIHESDTVPGKVNRWAGKFAKKIAISFPGTAEYFPKEKTALVGNPVRKSLNGSSVEEGRELFKLEIGIPTLLILGGSQGSQKINDTILDIAGELVKFYQVIHQCGKNNEEDATSRLNTIMETSLFKNRYHLFPYLNEGQLRAASKVTDLAIARAGSSTIFEIANWGVPSILIPLENSAQDHQRENAYSYARNDAGVVLEENNLTPNVLASEIKKLLSEEKKLGAMKEAAKSFARPDAAKKIAEEILSLALEHAR